MKPTVSLSEIELKKEHTYFNAVLTLAVLCWLVVFVSIIGILYGLLIALFIWLANGLFIARIRSESVLVTKEQMPVLHKAYMEVVARLELIEVPPLYIVQSNGVLNAFATRRSGRHFVVVYSDMLEACGEDTPQIRFLLGHELGHVRSNHVIKKVLLAPGLFFPLIGSAYSRACEGTCDRYGAYAADDLEAAAQAVMIMAGGKIAWREMDPAAFGDQYKKDRGFFVSWHELTSGYPTLSQRTSNLLSMDISPQPVRQPRHPLAYLFAIFTAGGRHGSGGNMLLTIALIAMMFGIAMPALQQARQRAVQAQAFATEGPRLRQLMFCKELDQNKAPVNETDQIPSNADTIYAVMHWQLAPGRHETDIELLDGSGTVVGRASYTFNATTYTWRTWVKVQLDATKTAQLKPTQLHVNAYLDGRQHANRAVPIGTQ